MSRGAWKAGTPGSEGAGVQQWAPATRRFGIRRRRKRGSDKWYVYAFVAARPVRSVKDKIRALTRRTSQADPRDVLIRLNQIVRGWANYFRHAVAKHTFRMLGAFLWHRVIMWLKTMHRWSWKDVRSGSLALTDHGCRSPRAGSN